MPVFADDMVDLSGDSPISLRGRSTEDFEMDITPMIDITFLLLIFFLVCSTPAENTAVDLAKARHGKGVSEKNSTIITISDEASDPAPVYLADGKSGEPLTNDLDKQSDLISEAVQTDRQEHDKEHVLIKADRNVAHRDVARVIKAVSRMEGAKIFLAVLESD
jgi:biopolymer transport protein ExbD